MAGWNRRRRSQQSPATLGRRQSRIEALESRCLMAPVPVFHSLPGAPASLYLDFDGHFEPVWGNHHGVTTPAYDSDGDPALYDPAELAFIEDVWKVVAEDYAPFRVNVTTEQPPVLARFCAAAGPLLHQAAALPAGSMDGFAGPALAAIDRPFGEFYARYDRYRTDLAAWQAGVPAAPRLAYDHSAFTPRPYVTGGRTALAAR